MANEPSKAPDGTLPGLVLERLELGRLRSACEALRASREPIALWVDSNWTLDATSLSRVLADSPELDLAFAVPGSGASSMGDPFRIAMRPVPVPGVAVRTACLGRVGLPDFGVPDAVLDAAAGWAMTAALALGGARCRAVPIPDAAIVRHVPESIDRLTPVGIAWLITQAQSWVKSPPPPNAPTPIVPRRSLEEAAR